jgi:hypothetical protein
MPRSMKSEQRQEATPRWCRSFFLELATSLAATDRGSNRERKSADGDGGDGDKRTPDEGRSGGGETRRDAGVMPVHEWWTTGEESEKAEEDG